jgi:MFS family permease
MANFVKQNLKWNYTVNLFDGAFFGFALGIASFTTIIPLFVSTMTSSAILIGLIPAIHTVGWQLPQLFTAKNVSRLKYFRPYVILLTINERVPFLGLAGIALLTPYFKDKTPLLILTFIMLVWQGIGGGFTANGWQNLIGKIIPSDYLTTFFGIQSSAANLLASAGAVIAGYILEHNNSDQGYAICFSVAAFLMLLSWISLASTKENERTAPINEEQLSPIFSQVINIFKTNTGFVWFIVYRNLIQFGLMASFFYTIFCVKKLGMDTLTIGWMTSLLFMTSVITNPIMGYLADHWKRRSILILGSVAGAVSAYLAFMITDQYLFFIVFLLYGIAGATIWNTCMTFAMEYGTEQNRPTYIGMSNTLTAPSAILAPIIGGWLADTFSYETTFIVSTALCIITILILQFLVTDPPPKNICVS